MPRCTRLALLIVPLVFSSCSGTSGGDTPVPAVPEERLESTQAVERGRDLFQRHCALCHGSAGDGHGARRAAMRTPPRDLTNPRWQAQTGPRDLFRVIRDGVPGTQMPAWRALDEGEIWDLVAYVGQLSGSVP